MIKLCLVKTGSHMYGTNTPESDTDFKGIFVPSLEDILLCNIPKVIKEDKINKNDKNKNTKHAVDKEWWSLHHFIKKALEGDTNAVEILFAEPTITSGVWEEFRKNRHKFLNKNMKSFVGYARSQAIKYSKKGSRIKVLKIVKKVLEEYSNKDPQLHEIWGHLPKNLPHVHVIEREDLPTIYQVCGIKMENTAHSNYFMNVINIHLDNYGNRANKAAKDGQDWKAISHAIRIAMELEEIIQTNDLIFPLQYANFIKDIKIGKYDYKHTQSYLNEILKRIEERISKCDLPNKSDHKWGKVFLLQTIKKYHNIS